LDRAAELFADPMKVSMSLDTVRSAIRAASYTNWFRI
jgi:hypothetical protein